MEKFQETDSSLEIREKHLTRSKRFVCVLGMPGAGKSTQIAHLQGMLGAESFHVGTFARESGDEEVLLRRDEARSKGELIKGLEADFLKKAGEEFAKGQSYTILDGFPRSKDQLDFLVKYCDERGIGVEILNLSFPADKAEELSFDRQLIRELRKGRPVSEDTEVKMHGKIKRAIAMDMEAIQEAQSLGLPVLDLDALQSKEDITTVIREHFGKSFESMKWEGDILQMVDRAEQELKEEGLVDVEIWPGAGLVYRPFWNGMYGAHMLSMDKDVHMGKPDHILLVLNKLRQISPKTRWSVDDRMNDTRSFYGIESDNLEGAMQTFPLTFRKAGVKSENGKLKVLMSPEVEKDLRNGIIRLDEALLEKIPDDKKEGFIDRAIKRARKTTQEYPGLKIVGVLKEYYENIYGPYIPVPFKKPEIGTFCTGWLAIAQEVARVEKENGVQVTTLHWSPEHITQAEILHMQKVKEFYDETEKEPSAPPVPDRAALPEPLESMRLAKEKLELIEQGVTLDISEEELVLARRARENVPCPEGFHSWFDYCSKELDDDSYREWLLNQRRSRSPVGGKDVDLAQLVDYDKSAQMREILEKKDSKDPTPKAEQGGTEQKVTHLGSPLKYHQETSSRLLETDDMKEFLSRHGLEEESKEIRQIMRMAMFTHDLGKLFNINTPGIHERIGAKLLRKVTPTWCDEKKLKLAEWIVRTHDVFGRLARGITEKKDETAGVQSDSSYIGALDPNTVREYLLESGLPLDVAARIHKKIWEADVNSVSTLRWVLPVADILEELICSQE